MATLVRTKDEDAELYTQLEADIPQPFPIDTYRREKEHNALVELSDAEPENPFADQADEHLLTVSVEQEETYENTEESLETQVTCAHELAPSLVYVQQTCLMTLNNLLSGAVPSASSWQPILPPRRHSMPSRPEVSSSSEPSSALHTLVSNLRNSGYGEMAEVPASTSESDNSALITELHRRVESISQDLSASDAHLARALISLLAHVDRLSRIDPRLSTSGLDGPLSLVASPHHSSIDLFGELSRHVLDLQTKRQGHDLNQASQSQSSQTQVEMALLWTRIDQELEAVSQICRHRYEPVPRPYSPGQLPPDYEFDEVDDYDTRTLPEYDYAHQLYSEKEKSNHQQSQTVPSDTHGEKMRMDLESVTMAIDRLYLVAPQLHNQRVELRKSKLEELERARLAGPSRERKETALKGKGKHKDVKELEKIFDMVDKASSRRLNSQSVIINGDMKARFEKAKEAEKQKRDAFVEHLAAHSDSGRIASQDAVLDTSGVRNPNMLLTLPEFIREGPSEDEMRELSQDPHALLTLKEMVNELPPPTPRPLEPTHSFENLRAAKKHLKALSKRSRSISAPPLAWLIPSLSRSPSTSGSSTPVPQTADSRGKSKELLIRYVAEYHEHLNRVLVFVGVDEGIVPGVDLEAKLIHFGNTCDASDMLVLRSGANVSAPLPLPVPVSQVPVEVHVQGAHFEIKLEAASHLNEETSESTSSQTSRLLDAQQVTDMNPTSFICSSCSSALIHTRTLAPDQKLIYNDLPSEYWTELLEAWMCHRDQQLNDRIAKYSQDLWPSPSQVLVGGSYFLFDSSVIVHSNLKTVESPPNCGDDWRRVLCICGAIIGRCRNHNSNGLGDSVVYRIPKYAVRPVSPTAEPCRIPFTAFVLEDMLEIVKAHATYRFVILDEEEEKPRLLIWLFKPSMRLSYTTTTQYTLPKAGTVNASKILFKILRNIPEGTGLVTPRAHSPSNSLDLDRVLEKYPGFPQAERLLYPRDICHRLATHLKESNTAYPFGVRVMTGLLTGWLRRD